MVVSTWMLGLVEDLAIATFDGSGRMRDDVSGSQ